MVGRHLPLKSKLIVALLLPLLALVALSAIQVVQLRDDARLAEEQSNELESNVAVVEVLRAVRSERDAQLTLGGASADDSTAEFLSRVRANTDQRIEEVLSDPRLADDTRQLILSTQSQLISARNAVGDEGGTIRSDLVEEMTTPNFEMTDDSVMGGLATYNEVVSDTIALVRVDDSAVVDAETAVDLTTLDVVTQFDELFRLEALAYLELSFIPPDEQPELLVQEAHVLGGQAEALEQTVALVASDRYSESIADLLSSPEYEEFRTLRAEILASGPGEVVVTESQILNSLLDVTTQLNEINQEIIVQADRTAAEARSDAQRSLLIGGGLTFLLSAMAVTIAYWSYRSIRRPLLSLTERSREIANHELPDAVRMLRQEGADAQAPEIVPIEAATRDEIGELVEAFNDMHRTAIELASDQATSRRTVAEMFVNLGRRNQKLLTRILQYLDSLEQEERDPETLEKLFKVDHLATRMRRNAESLLVLAGARASRVFGESVGIADVARSALTEVEGYERVHLDIRGDVQVNGDVVADLAHLLAELMENALAFSPPSSPVVVIATETANDGYYMAVADQGIGMSNEELDVANEQIRKAVTLEETSSKFLGHHVVGRLAARHGIEVQLLEGMDMGVTARIMLPNSVLDRPENADGLDRSGSGASPALEVDSEIALALERVDPQLGEGELSAAEWGRVDSITDVPDSADVPDSGGFHQEHGPGHDPLHAPSSQPAPPTSPQPRVVDSEAPEGRPVLDPALLPRRRRDDTDEASASEGQEEADSNLSFGDQVANAERRNRAPEAGALTQSTSPTTASTEFVPLTRRQPGTVRAAHDAMQPPIEPSRNAVSKPQTEEGPRDVRQSGEAFASSLVGFQQGVSRAIADPSNDDSSETRSNS